MSVFHELVNLLINNKFHISAAESCTGGMFISRIIDYPGTSAIVDRSFITYSEVSKQELLGIPQEIIAQNGVVSEEVAYYMAKGVCEVSSSDIGVGITGNAGPSTCDEDKTVGTVCFGINICGEITVYTQKFTDSDRNGVRNAACVFAAEKLVELIKSKKD